MNVFGMEMEPKQSQEEEGKDFNPLRSRTPSYAIIYGTSMNRTVICVLRTILRHVGLLLSMNYWSLQCAAVTFSWKNMGLWLRSTHLTTRM